MRLIIVRHGETIENRDGVIQGHHHGTLSETGKAQAERVGERLKEERIDVIYSSDLRRTADTARTIAQHHPGTPFHLTERLRERNLGEYQGRRWSDVEALRPLKEMLRAPSDGETLEQLHRRMVTFLQELKRKHAGEIVLLAGHEFANKALIAAAMGRGWEEVWEMPDTENAGITIIDVADDGHEVGLFNSGEHLH